MATTRPAWRHPMALWAGFIVLLFAGYAVGWFAYAGWLDGKVKDGLEDLESRGIEVVCSDRHMAGFPFRIGIRCTQLQVDDTAQNLIWSAGAVRSAAQIYDQRRNVIEVDGPLNVEGDDFAMKADWRSMRGYVELSDPAFEIASVSTDAFSADFEGGRFDTKSAAFHARPAPQSTGQASGRDLDVAGNFTDAVLDLVQQDTTRFTLTHDQTLVGGYTAIVENGEAPIDFFKGGGELILRSVVLEPLSGGKLGLSGRLRLVDGGLLDGTLKIGLDDADAIGRFIAATQPEFGPLASGIAQGVGMLGQEATFGQSKMRAIEITLNRGRAKVGFIGLGKIPPLFQD